MTFHYPGYSVRQLTIAAIVRSLAGATVHSMIGSPVSGYDVELQLDRPSHAEAMHEIRVAFAQLGFGVAQAVVTEWLTSTLEFALFGGAGGGALGATSKDPGVTILCALIGAGAGAIAAQFMKALKARFDARLIHPYGPEGWSVTPQQPPAAQTYSPPWPYPG